MNFERRSPFRNRHFRTQALGSRRVRPRHREGATSRRAKSADAKMASLILGTADTPVWLLCSQPDQVSGDCMRGDPPSVQVYGRKFEFAKFQSLQAPDKMQKLFSTLSGRPENIVRVLVLARLFSGVPDEVPPARFRRAALASGLRAVLTRREASLRIRRLFERTPALSYRFIHFSLRRLRNAVPLVRLWTDVLLQLCAASIGCWPSAVSIFRSRGAHHERNSSHHRRRLPEHP